MIDADIEKAYAKAGAGGWLCGGCFSRNLDLESMVCHVCNTPREEGKKTAKELLKKQMEEERAQEEALRVEVKELIGMSE